MLISHPAIDTRPSPPIFAAGRTTTQSQRITVLLDINPKTLLRFFNAAAAKSGTSLGPFPPYIQRILDLPSTDTSVVGFPDDSEPSCQGGFDLRAAVRASLRGLQTSLPISSTVKIDEYQTDLAFRQDNVPTVTDDSVLYLIGPAAAPLVEIIVDEAVLRVDIANATRLTNEGFMVALAGALVVDLPTAAFIEFPEPLKVGFQGRIIAEIALPPLCSGPPTGIPDLRTSGQLTILDQGRFTAFAAFLLREPSFEWVLSSDKVVVRTLGIRYSGIKLQKTIRLDALNGLKGITIETFDAPSDSPGRINIEAATRIPSPASLGVEIGEVTFDLFFKG